jgi:hypothetical protein
MMILPTDPILRQLVRFFGEAGKKNPDETPGGRAMYVMRAVLICEETFKASLAQISRDYQPGSPKKDAANRTVLEEFEKKIDLGELQLKEEVIAVRDRLAAVIAVIQPPETANNPACAIREEAFISWLSRQGSHLELGSLMLQAVSLGDQVAYNAVLNLGPLRQHALFGSIDYDGRKLIDLLKERWIEAKVDPEKREELAALDRTIQVLKTFLAEKRSEARALAGLPSPERQFIQR